MTLQEAIEITAKEYGDVIDPDKSLMITRVAAELYARSKFEQGAKEQLILANQHCMKLHRHVLLETPKPEFNP